MKKWLNFFFLGFFSHRTSKEGVRRGYANVFLGFILTLALLWSGFILGDMLPFGIHYEASPDFSATVHNVFANPELDKRLNAEIENGDLKLRGQDGEHLSDLLINTFERDSDRQSYSVNGCNVVVDLRPADTLAEIRAYCVSNDGKNTVISYEDYLTLSEVARLNFDFKLEYTGGVHELDDETVDGYLEYIDGLGGEVKDKADDLSSDLSAGRIEKNEYDRAVYELYFTNYYPEITAYESTSKLPLLRNYYYHQYISGGINNYLFVFDDYMTGSFETKGGMDVSFYGFYSNLENGAIVADGATQEQADKSVDSFIKNSYRANWFLSAYAYMVNIVSLAPFIALMLMVAALLSYSVLKLKGIESINSLGAMLKIVGSFTWFSGLVSSLLTVILSFFVEKRLIAVMPLVLFFVALVIRSIVFVVKENQLYMKQLASQTEV